MTTSAEFNPGAEAFNTILPALFLDFIITRHLPRHAFLCGNWKLSTLTGLALPTPAIVAGPSISK